MIKFSIHKLIISTFIGSLIVVVGLFFYREKSDMVFNFLLFIGGIINILGLYLYRMETLRVSKERHEEIKNLSQSNIELTRNNSELSNKLLYPIPDTFYAEIGISFNFRAKIDTKEVSEKLKSNPIIFSNMSAYPQVAKLREEFLARIKYVGLNITSLDKNSEIGFYLNMHELIPTMPNINDNGNLSWYGYNRENNYFFFIAGRIALNHYRNIDTKSLLEYEGKKFEVSFTVQDANKNHSNIEILANSETSIYLFSSNAVIATIGDFEKREGQFIGAFKFLRN